jgi:hypothetical protein
MQRGDNEVFALLLEWFNFPTVPMQAEVNFVYMLCVCVCVCVGARVSAVWRSAPIWGKLIFAPPTYPHQLLHGTTATHALVPNFESIPAHTHVRTHTCAHVRTNTTRCRKRTQCAQMQDLLQSMCGRSGEAATN